MVNRAGSSDFEEELELERVCAALAAAPPPYREVLQGLALEGRPLAPDLLKRRSRALGWLRRQLQQRPPSKTRDRERVTDSEVLELIR
jgi:hypothetical protein